MKKKDIEKLKAKALSSSKIMYLKQVIVLCLSVRCTKLEIDTRAYLINSSDEALRKSRLRLPPWNSQGVIDDDNDESTIYEMGSKL